MPRVKNTRRSGKNITQINRALTTTLNDIFWENWDKTNCVRPLKAGENKSFVYFCFEARLYEEIIDYDTLENYEKADNKLDGIANQALQTIYHLSKQGLVRQKDIYN